jgi:nucleotide-binding universal stress UspA family protein
MDVTDDMFCFAGCLAGRLSARLELLHVIDATQPDVRHKHYEQRCKDWSTKLRGRGVQVTWNVIYGRADAMIAQRAAEWQASLILFGLHRSGNQMIDCTDGVVSATIRQARCPVMTVPPALMDMQ